MRIILTLTFLFISLIAHSQATQGTRLTAPIVPNDSSDVYPTHDETFGKGGFRSVGTITQRDAIKPGFRKEGMLVKVIIEDKIYTLTGGIDNANWQLVKFSSDSINNLKVTQKLLVEALPGAYATTFPFQVIDSGGFTRAAVSSKGMIIAGRLHDPTVNVDGLALIGSRNRLTGIDGIAIGKNVGAISDSSIVFGLNLNNTRAGSVQIGKNTNYLSFDSDSTRALGKWPFLRGLNDRLFKYDAVNNYYRAFSSRAEAGYTPGAFYLSDSDRPTYLDSYTHLNVSTWLGVYALEAGSHIYSKDRIYANGGYWSNEMDSSSTYSYQASVKNSLYNGHLMYMDPILRQGVYPGRIAYFYDTYRLLTPGSYRARWYNYHSNPVDIEYDGSINIPAGAQFKINNVAIGGVGSEVNNLSPLWARGSTLLEGNRTLVSMNNANYDTIKNQTGASMAITLPSAGTWLINFTVQANATDLDCNTWPSRLITGIARSNNTPTIIREVAGGYLYIPSPPYVNYTGTVCDTHHSIIYTTTTSNDRIVGVVKFGSTYTGGEIYVDSAYINAIKVAP